MRNQEPLTILGSARKESDTKKCIEHLLSNMNYQIVDLLDLTIFPYNYNSNYSMLDEFDKLIDQILKNKTIIFATPVY